MMTIEINPNTTLGDIKNKFHERFPFLKIEFFEKPQFQNQGNNKRDLITNNHIKVGELSTQAMSITLVFSSKMSIGEMENFMEDKLHLHIQIFSKSGDIWLETIQTDSLTLQELNEKSKQRNEESIDKDEPADYQEMD